MYQSTPGLPPSCQGFAGPGLGSQDLPAIPIPHEAHQHRGPLGSLVIPQAMRQRQNGARAVRPEGGGLAAIGHQPGTARATQRVDQATGGVVRQRVLVGKTQTPMAQGDAGLTCGVKAEKVDQGRKMRHKKHKKKSDAATKPS